MFVRYKNAKNILIDVRTEEEFKEYSLCHYNVPIMNRKSRYTMKKFYLSAFFIILYSLIKNRKYIRKRLIKISKNKNIPLTFACSRGRLRSPLMCIYARYIGIKSNVLWMGVRGNRHIE